MLAKIDQLHRMLPLEDCERARARLRSCSGVGAQWLAATPTSPKTSFTDEEFRAVKRFRLGLETNDLQVCPHITAEGVQCEEECDRWGYHLQQCASGGGYFVGHDTTCAAFADLAGGSEGIPGVVVDWKSQVAAWPRATRGYEADVGLFHIPVLKMSSMSGKATEKKRANFVCNGDSSTTVQLQLFLLLL